MFGIFLWLFDIYLNFFLYFRDLFIIEIYFNIFRMEIVGKEIFRREFFKVFVIVYIIIVVLVGFILIWIIFKKRRKGKVIDIIFLLYSYF